MRLFAILAVLLAGGGPHAADHRAVFRDFALQFACVAATRRRGASRKAR